MAEEDQALADQTLERAAVRLTPQQFYNQKFTSTNAYLLEVRGYTMTKAEMVHSPPEPPLTVEDYMLVSNLSVIFYVFSLVAIALFVLQTSIAISGCSEVGRSSSRRIQGVGYEVGRR